MIIEYYYALPSPFAYLGSLKFQSIAKKYNVEITEKPCDLVGGIFVKTGGIPVPQRSLQRQKYRLDEIKRWSEFLNIKTNIKPKFFPPKDPHLPAKFTIAANLLGVGDVGEAPGSQGTAGADSIIPAGQKAAATT